MHVFPEIVDPYPFPSLGGSCLAGQIPTASPCVHLPGSHMAAPVDGTRKRLLRLQCDTAVMLRGRYGSRCMASFSESQGQGYDHGCSEPPSATACKDWKSSAPDYEIDPKRVGVRAFAAGMHLIRAVTTVFAHGNAESDGPLDCMCSRPVVVLLFFPAICMKDEIVHMGLWKILIGGGFGGDFSLFPARLD